MALEANEKLMNPNASPMNVILDFELKVFMRERTQVIIWFCTKSNIIKNKSNFRFTDFKMEKKFFQEYHNWGQTR